MYLLVCMHIISIYISMYAYELNGDEECGN